MTISPSDVVTSLKIEEIGIPEERVFSVLEPETIDEMKTSIEDVGILQPLQVLDVDGQLILLDGYHRLVAAKELGKLEVPCIVRKGSMDEVLIHNIILNRQRGKSDPVGEGLVLKTLVEEHGLTVTEAAKKCHMTKGWASKLLKLQTLDEYTLGLVRQGKLFVTSAFFIADLPDLEDRKQLVQDAITWGYSVERTKAAVIQRLNPDREPEPGKYIFAEDGKPEYVYPVCFLCGDELKHAEKIERFCVNCYEDLLGARKHLAQKEAEQPPPPPPPAPQPQAPSPQTGCQHRKVVTMITGDVVCLDCRAMFRCISEKATRYTD